MPEQPLRIVSLIPSATDICVHLGLSDAVVGVTHCCDTEDLPSSVVVVTEDQVDAASNSQGDIHTKVVANGEKAVAALEAKDSCSLSTTDDDIPTLYPINKTLLKEVSPTLIITQDLCHVCAPSSGAVFKALRDCGIDATVVLLTPMNLWDVITNMQQVADAAGMYQRGKELCDELRSNLAQLEYVIQSHRSTNSKKRVLVMEWVDPPFCGGHWIPDMAHLIGTQLAIDPNPDGRSRQVSWSEIEDADPDVVVVACCGFDLQRNLADAGSSAEHFARLRSHKEGNLYAANGDQYFARPSPKLLIGAVVMALCVYKDTEEPNVVRAIKELPFASKALDGYQTIDC